MIKQPLIFLGDWYLWRFYHPWEDVKKNLAKVESIHQDFRTDGKTATDIFWGLASVAVLLSVGRQRKQ